MEIEDKLIELFNGVNVKATYNTYEKDFCGVYLENLEIYEFEIDTFKIEGLLTFRVAKGDCGYSFENIKKNLAKAGMLITNGGIRLKVDETGTRYKSFNFDVIIHNEIEKILEVKNGNNS